MNSNAKDPEASRNYDFEAPLPTDLNGERNFPPGEVWMPTNSRDSNIV